MPNRPGIKRLLSVAEIDDAFDDITNDESDNSIVNGDAERDTETTNCVTQSRSKGKST